MAQNGRAAPQLLMPNAKSAIVTALAYPKPAPARTVGSSKGVVAQFALGTDYHTVVHAKLRALADECQRIVGRPVAFRACVDSAPLLERDLAVRAGLGFFGKSTLLIAPGLGSYFMLGELLTDLELPEAQAHRARCGRCTACLDACPTRAFVAPYVLDARRCVSYLTIENRGEIAPELRPLIGRHVFGCDICQSVCPFNASRKPHPSAPELAARPALIDPDLAALLHLTASGYRRLVSGTALRRVNRAQLARNAAIALGNSV